MDNEHEDEREVDLSPDPERVVLLLELVNRYGLVTASRLAPRTEAQRHHVAYGHPLRRGCCAPR